MTGLWLLRERNRSMKELSGWVQDTKSNPIVCVNFGDDRSSCFLRVFAAGSPIRLVVNDAPNGGLKHELSPFVKIRNLKCSLSIMDVLRGQLLDMCRFKTLR